MNEYGCTLLLRFLEQYDRRELSRHVEGNYGDMRAELIDPYPMPGTTLDIDRKNMVRDISDEIGVPHSVIDRHLYREYCVVRSARAAESE